MLQPYIESATILSDLFSWCIIDAVDVPLNCFDLFLCKNMFVCSFEHSLQ